MTKGLKKGPSQVKVRKLSVTSIFFHNKNLLPQITIS